MVKDTIVGDVAGNEASPSLNQNTWRSKKERKIVQKVRARFDEMKQARQNSCPFPSPQNMIESADWEGFTGGSSNYNWDNLWEYAWELYTMKHQYIAGKSNLKSSTSFSPVEAAMADFQDTDVGTLLTATEPGDVPKITILKSLLKHLHNKGDFKIAKNGSFNDAAIYGTSIEEITRIRKVRDVETIITNSSDAKKHLDKIMKGASKEDSEKIKKRLDGGKPLTKKERIIEYDDIGRINKSIFEVYIDPDARCMRGFAYEAQDLIDRTIPSLAQFRSEYENSLDPFVIRENVKKVRGVGITASSYDSSTPFFSVPGDLKERANNVEVLKYYNKRTDKFYIIANDVLVREGPLPFNHKQIPYVVHTYVKLQHSIYGMGLPYLLEGIQSEDESLKNMMIEQMKFNLMPPLLRRKDYFEGDEQMEFYEAGSVIDVAGNPAEAAMWMQGSAPRFDYFQMRNVLNEEAIRTVGINTMASALPQPGQPVRNNLMAQESTQKMLRKAIQNWAEGEKEAVRQEISLMRQIYPESYISKVDGKTGEKKFKSIRLEGVELIPEYEREGDDAVKLVNVRQEEIDGNSYFEIKDEYLDITGDVDIEVDTSSFPLISQALKLQKIDEFMNRMVPFWQNPQLLQAPGAVETIKAYVRELGLENGQKILDEFKDDDSELEVNDAVEQNHKMLKGENIPGVPGESDAHKMIHIGPIIDLSTMLQDEQYSPEEKQKLAEAMARIYKHLVIDDNPKFLPMAAVDQAMQQAAPPPPPEAPQAGGMPMDPQMMAEGMPPQAMAPDGSAPLGAQTVMPQM